MIQNHPYLMKSKKLLKIIILMTPKYPSISIFIEVNIENPFELDLVGDTMIYGQQYKLLIHYLIFTKNHFLMKLTALIGLSLLSCA